MKGATAEDSENTSRMPTKSRNTVIGTIHQSFLAQMNPDSSPNISNFAIRRRITDGIRFSQAAATRLNTLVITRGVVPWIRECLRNENGV